MGMASFQREGLVYGGASLYRFCMRKTSIASAVLLAVMACASCSSTNKRNPAVAVAWAGCEKVGDHYTNGQGIDLMFIPAGTFMMGSPENEDGREPEYEAFREANEQKRNPDEVQHQVTLTHAFLMGKTPVTRAQYQAVMGEVPPALTDEQGKGIFPTSAVTWFDARAFCQKLTESEQAEGTLPSGWAYRLPTEAEWEYACRAGTAGPRYGKWDDIMASITWGSNIFPVGQKKPNAWGLYDMIGNVHNWCVDIYADYPAEAVIDPIHQQATDENERWSEMRVFRGSPSYFGDPFCTRAASRQKGGASFAYWAIGFRVVCSRLHLPSAKD